ncbi:phytanoyl-CoA dioxygenase family protein [Candidatus Poribacteria bacterium]|nr:phytanoyl-CoA dioxygenase family protein [Candidatus Poribacteria bacterium]
MAEPSGMTDHERYFFDVNGYLVLEDVLSQEQIAHLREVIERQKLPPATDAIESQRFGGFFLWDQGFRDMLTQPRILGVLKELLGEKLRLDHAYGIVMSTSNVGLQLHGGAAPYDPAQYYIYRNGRMYNGLTVASWALVDVGPDDGGFCCIPGSHKGNIPLPNDVRHFEAHRDWVRQVPQKAGSVVIFTEALTHGTLPWRAPYDRLSILLKYSPAHEAWGRANPPSPELDALLDDAQKRLFEPPYIWRREPV